MKNKLIVTAHDFGLTHSGNLGVLYAINHPENIFTEYSLLPNAPGSMEAVKTMVDKNGNFLDADATTWDFSCIDNFNDDEIITEIDAQYDWFVKNVGRKPS